MKATTWQSIFQTSFLWAPAESQNHLPWITFSNIMQMFLDKII